MQNRISQYEIVDKPVDNLWISCGKAVDNFLPVDNLWITQSCPQPVDILWITRFLALLLKPVLFSQTPNGFLGLKTERRFLKIKISKSFTKEKP